MCRFRVRRLFRTLALLLLVLMFLSLLQIRVPLSMPSVMRPDWTQRTMEVVVHLDLKGAPPTLEYLRQLLPRLREAGATGLLIEYDNTFCFEGELNVTNAEYCYNRDELQQFLKDAIRQRFIIIPMVQSLDDLGSLLGNAKYANLSELQGSGQICTRQIASMKVLEQRLTQVLEFHGAVHPLHLVHIGLDAMPYAHCPLCSRASPGNIFLEHLQYMADFFHLEYPKIKVLIWADTFNEIPLAKIMQLDLPKNIIPVLRNYEALFASNDLKGSQVQQKFSKLWLSSAYKGADKKARASSTPNLLNRYHNHFYWLLFKYDFETTRVEGNSIGGLILSGRSRLRYSRRLLEPLPAAVPALLLSLLVARLAAFPASPLAGPLVSSGRLRNISTPSPDLMESLLTLSELNIFHSHVQKPLTRLLQCKTTLDISRDNADDLANCDFYEKDIYEALHNGSLPGELIMKKYFSTDVIKIIEDDTRNSSS